LHSPHVFHFPQDVSREQVFDALSSHGSLVQDEAKKFEDVYLDSFDWRLYQRGMTCLKRSDQLFVRPLGSDAVAQFAQVDGFPRFAKDLPEGELRGYLEGLLEVRALLPLVKVGVERFPFRLRDSNDKTRLRIEWEDLCDLDREGSLWQRARLFIMTGYEDVAYDVCKRLIKLGGVLVQVEGDALPDLPKPNAKSEDLVLQIMRAHGLKPGDYVSKPKLELRADMTGATAAAVIFTKLVDVIEANEQGSRDDIDIEFLHDFRVATRKTRAALSQLKRLFEPEVLQYWQDKFRELGRMSNLMRDLDVYLCDADVYRAMLPEEQQPDLEPFFQHLCDTRVQALAQLKQDWDDFGLRDFLHAWRKFWLEEDGGKGPAAGKPIGVLAGKMILKRYARIMEDGGSITDATPDQELHDLRIQCKKLRYVLEFFASLVPEQKLKVLVKQLKGLQDVLGKFNDYYVQQETLKQYAESLGKTKAQRQTVFAVGVLVGKLHQKQRDVRTHFAEAFNHFASPEVQQLIHDVCAGTREVRS
jgi:CHAD domain-containing protein